MLSAVFLQLNCEFFIINKERLLNIFKYYAIINLILVVMKEDET